MKKLAFKGLLVLTLFVGLVGGGVMANSDRAIEIGEVAWSGTAASWADEWIELRNVSEEKVDLTGWTLFWEDVSVHLGEEIEDTIEVRETVLGPGEAFLLERSDDETVSSVEADVIYKGSLANSGERMVLKDDQGNEVHVLDSSEGWQAGTSSDGEPGYASMVLREGGWITWESVGAEKDANDNQIYGTPGKLSEETD